MKEQVVIAKRAREGKQIAVNEYFKTITNQNDVIEMNKGILTKTNTKKAQATQKVKCISSINKAEAVQAIQVDYYSMIENYENLIPQNCIVVTFSRLRLSV